MVFPQLLFTYLQSPLVKELCLKIAPHRFMMLLRFRLVAMVLPIFYQKILLSLLRPETRVVFQCPDIL